MIGSSYVGRNPLLAGCQRPTPPIPPSSAFEIFTKDSFGAPVGPWTSRAHPVPTLWPAPSFRTRLSVIRVGLSHARVTNWWLPYRYAAWYPVRGLFARPSGRVSCPPTEPWVGPNMWNHARTVPPGTFG